MNTPSEGRDRQALIQPGWLVRLGVSFDYTAMLVVRLAMHSKLNLIHQTHKRCLQIALACVLTLTGIAYAGSPRRPYTR